MGVIEDVKTLAGQKKPKKQENPTLKKILVVEDEKPLLEFYVDLLETEGFEVLSAVDGQKGLDLAISEKPDLVLLDLLLPVMNGKEMLRRLRAVPEFKKLPVIVLTNAGDIENMRQTRFYDEAREFLIKSNVNPEEIVRKVKLHLGV
jgi:DNA-binding response OmpR family regulator